MLLCYPDPNTFCFHTKLKMRELQESNAIPAPAVCQQGRMVHSNVVPVPVVEQNVRYAVVCD